MTRDFKIGLCVGFVVVAAAVIWLCTRPELGAEARVLRADPQRPAETQTSNVQDQVRQPPLATLPAEASAKAGPDTPSHPDQNRGQQPYTRYHIVQKDETLFGISRDYYGSGDQWERIFEANRSVLSDPDKLRPGMKLLIPDRPAE